MSGLSIIDVDRNDAGHRAQIISLNYLCYPKVFPLLEERHFEDGHWWLVFDGSEAIAFAGMVPFVPFAGVGYCKRCFVKPDYRGRKLHVELLRRRIAKAKEIGWTALVSETSGDNVHSIRNFIRAGFRACSPEQKWGKLGSVYFAMDLQ